MYTLIYFEKHNNKTTKTTNSFWSH